MTNTHYYDSMGYPNCSPIANYPSESLESMYPDIYNRVYPKVQHMCNMMDTPNNPQMYPCPRREAVERMTDDIYMQVMNEMDENYWDTMTQQQIPGYDDYYGGGYRRGSFRRGGFLRDIVSIILIRELLGRRRRRFY